jgi:AraC-like DNA-binding protein
LVRCVIDAAAPGGLLTNPVIAEPLQEALLAGLLRAIDHQYREALEEPVRSWGPGTVRRSIDTIEAFPQRPLTTAALAADAGVSVRVLEECWRRHRGVRPIRYLYEVRVARAHVDLQEHARGDDGCRCRVAMGIRAACAVRYPLRRALRRAPGPDPARAGVRLTGDQVVLSWRRTDVRSGGSAAWGNVPRPAEAKPRATAGRATRNPRYAEALVRPGCPLTISCKLEILSRLRQSLPCSPDTRVSNARQVPLRSCTSSWCSDLPKLVDALTSNRVGCSVHS